MIFQPGGDPLPPWATFAPASGLFGFALRQNGRGLPDALSPQGIIRKLDLWVFGQRKDLDDCPVVIGYIQRAGLWVHGERPRL